MNNVGELMPLDTTPDPELSPGHPETCAGNDDSQRCCDECDHFLLCFPEFAYVGSEAPEKVFEAIEEYMRREKRMELFADALIYTYPSILTDDFADVLKAFEENMREEFGTCPELDSEWACDRIRGLRIRHMLDTSFPPENRPNPPKAPCRNE